MDLYHIKNDIISMVLTIIHSKVAYTRLTQTLRRHPKIRIVPIQWFRLMMMIS